MVSQAVEDARRGSLRISVAVVDEAGALLAFARMDGATRLSARTAMDKTQTVILTGKATLDLGREWREDLTVEPELFYGMIARPDVVPFGGGVAVRVEGGFEQEADAPYGGDDPEDVPEAHGLAVYRASLRWTRHTIAALRAAPVPAPLPSSS